MKTIDNLGFSTCLVRPFPPSFIDYSLYCRNNDSEAGRAQCYLEALAAVGRRQIVFISRSTTWLGS